MSRRDPPRHAVATDGRLPTFLIIGAPKAGTTSLASYLAAHPDVFVADEKEIHFFDRYFNFKKGLDWYRGRFRDSGKARAVGEASPTYMYRDLWLDRLEHALPDARLVVVLRNPIDRAYSHYWWERTLTERRTFADAAHDEMRPTAETPRRRRYLEGGRYLERLEKVCERFPREALLVVVLEDFKSSLDAIYAEVCRHIGVDDTFRPPHLGAVENQAYALRWEWLRPALYRTRAWRRLPEGMASRLDKLNRKPMVYSPMDDQLRAELVAYFTEPNRALARWLGRDLSVWNR